MANGEIYDIPQVDIAKQLESLSGVEQAFVRRFYESGMKQIDTLSSFLLLMGLVGVRLPRNTRIVPSKSNRLIFQQKGSPYGEAESWYTLNAMVDGELPPYNMLTVFLSDLEGWLVLLLEEFEHISNQGIQALDRGEAALAKLPNLKISDRKAASR